MTATANTPTRPCDVPGSPLASQRYAYNLSLYFERLPQRLYNAELIAQVRKLEAKHLDQALSFREYRWLKRLYVASSPLNKAALNVAWWVADMNGLRG